MEHSAISWTHHTFNPWVGCTQVSPACDNCYAMILMDHRYRKVEWGRGKQRNHTSLDNWKLPLRWHRKAEQAGERHRVFCASLADVFDGESRRELDKWRADLWDLIERTPNLDWLLLTKRIGNVKRMAPWKSDWPSNVWIGTSVENAEWAKRRLPVLSEIPAAVRFVSAEPLLEDFSIAGYNIDWLITGGESGHGYRPLNLDHARSLRDQCLKAKIPFFFKQVGGRTPKAGGDLLDGRRWQQFPAPRNAAPAATAARSTRTARP